MHEYYRKRRLPCERYIDLVGLFTNPVGTLLGPTGLGVTGGGSAVSPGGVLGPGSEMGAYASAAMARETAREANEFTAKQAQITRDYNASEAELGRLFSSAEAQKNRDFQAAQVLDAQKYNTAMSNSAYQRAVADMKAAGINPMLAYMQGGASAPTSPVGSGSSPSSSTASASGASGQQSSWAEMLQRGVQNTISSSFEKKRLDADLALKDSEVDKNVAQEKFFVDNSAKVRADKKLVDQQRKTEEQRTIQAGKEAKGGKYVGGNLPSVIMDGGFWEKFGANLYRWWNSPVNLDWMNW